MRKSRGCGHLLYDSRKLLADPNGSLNVSAPFFFGPPRPRPWKWVFFPTPDAPKAGLPAPSSSVRLPAHWVSPHHRTLTLYARGDQPERPDLHPNRPALRVCRHRRACAAGAQDRSARLIDSARCRRIKSRRRLAGDRPKLAFLLRERPQRATRDRLGHSVGHQLRHAGFGRGRIEYPCVRPENANMPDVGLSPCRWDRGRAPSSHTSAVFLIKLALRVRECGAQATTHRRTAGATFCGGMQPLRWPRGRGFTRPRAKAHGWRCVAASGLSFSNL